MLAGRKLLLADDSPTIQKVVELTFADEGVSVISVSSGNEALAKLAEVKPDVVLADVCMPPPSGYEICEYIKQNAELRHIPVILLVGSFEPFDEAEARRVCADDILTKPFQSIRRLIDRVGGLVSGKQDPEQVPTAELPAVEETPADPVQMSTHELEVTTANTQPLPESMADQSPSGSTESSVDSATVPAGISATTWKEIEMETNTSIQPDTTMEAGDVLLDLGDLTPTRRSSAEDFVLDLDLDEAPQPAIAESGASSRSHAFVEPEVSAPAGVDWQIESEPEDMALMGTAEAGSPAPTTAQLHDTQEWRQEPDGYSSPASVENVPAGGSPMKMERIWDEPRESERIAPTTGPVNAGQLSPEMIDAIARRAVEQLSEKVVQQIAWEVVPQLAELMIRRKLEEKETQSK